MKFFVVFVSVVLVMSLKTAHATEETGSFDRALEFTLRWEGGYVNNPADRGGATNKGITQSTYDSWRTAKSTNRQSVALISDDEVKTIYFERYWLQAKCHQIATHSEALAIAHFDWAVNGGVSQATKMLQGVVGTQADGSWGPKSQTALLASGPDVLGRYLAEREARYHTLATRKNQDRFLNGWLNRLSSLRTALTE